MGLFSASRRAQQINFVDIEKKVDKTFIFFKWRIGSDGDQ